MKKETIVTAVVFLAVGFLAGYITDAQINWSSRQKAAQAAPVPAEMPPAGAPATPAGGAMAQQGLPEGHPPIDNAAVVQGMEEAAAKNPQDVQVRLNLANYLYDQKLYDKAIQWYQQALAIDPKNVNARTDMGTAYFFTGRPKDAIGQYEKSLQIDANHEPTLANMIVVNLDGTHDVAAAQKYWDRLNKLNPGNAALPRLKEQIDAARASGAH